MTIKNNNSSSNTIENIYDRHAAIMYGCIFKIVTHTDTAENILKEIFFDFQKNSAICMQNIDNSMWFAKHAMKKAFGFIKAAPFQKDFAITALQQILEMKSIKNSAAENPTFAVY